MLSAWWHHLQTLSAFSLNIHLSKPADSSKENMSRTDTAMSSSLYVYAMLDFNLERSLLLRLNVCIGWELAMMSE